MTHGTNRQANAAVLETAHKVLVKKRKRNKVWITEETLYFRDKGRTQKPNRDMSIQGREAYHSLNRHTKKKMKEAKEAYVDPT